MFDGFDGARILAMTDQEKRWLDNIKKAFADADKSLQSSAPEDGCLESLFKGIDTAKTLRRSLRGEDTSGRENRARFIEFLGLEIPAAQSGAQGFPIPDEKGVMQSRTLGEVLYLARCKIHENENLNAAEEVHYPILFEWRQLGQVGAVFKDGRLRINGYFIANRLREVLAKFVSGIEGMIAFAERRSFSIGIRPPLGSIQPQKRRS